MTDELKYDSIAGLVAATEAAGEPISALVLRQQARQLEKTEAEVFAQMRDTYAVMAACIGPGCEEDLRSASGLSGGDAFKMRRAVESGKNLTGGVLGGALYRALAVSELNAAMGRVVAAPTAGSCGILPAAVLTMQQEKGCSERDCVMALFTASAVGMVITANASVAGAQGGCQAEIGTASAMAAGALVSLRGGTNEQIGHAVAMALKNLMGLVCDPVAGLVEVPCVKRNVIGAVNAISAADMALAGIESRIPVDEVIDAMGEVGRRMPVEFRETALGGLAATPTGKAVKERMPHGAQ